MNIWIVSEAFLIALCFVAWTVIGGRLAPGPLLSTVVAVVTAVVVPLFSFSALRSGDGNSVGPKVLVALVLLGLANALGLFRYAVRVAEPGISVASFVVTVSIAVVVVAPALEWMLFGKQFSLWHLSGYACAGLTIFLLSR